MLANATNQGMIGQNALDLRLDKLPKQALVCDIIYNPRETPLIEAAKRRGHRTVTGLGMLLHQGIPAWKAWFGIAPEVTSDLRARIEATL
jgi:shikimate dehydrogenase